MTAPPADIFAEADKAASWANPLSRKERAVLARMLAHLCKQFYDAALPRLADARTESEYWKNSLGYALIESSAEMSSLHLDVTERAKAAQPQPGYSTELELNGPCLRDDRFAAELAGVLNADEINAVAAQITSGIAFAVLAQRGADFASDVWADMQAMIDEFFDSSWSLVNAHKLKFMWSRADVAFSRPQPSVTS